LINLKIVSATLALGEKLPPFTPGSAPPLLEVDFAALSKCTQ